MIKKISIIFPIYNEQNRLKKSLIQIENFIKKKLNKKIEIIFVNDGSFDQSKELLIDFKKKINKKRVLIKVLNLKNNAGKGFALYYGIKNSSYNWVLTIDIDLSVSIHQLIKWEKKNLLSNNYSVYLGSRRHKDSKVKKIFIRSFVGRVMSFFVKFFLKINILDTQCGFKLYKKKIALIIFNNLKRPRYEHDVEVILKLQQKNIKVKELPVNWIHKKNSKLNLFTDPIKMLYGIFLLKFLY